MRITASLMMALLATTATAQIPMSDYARTFTSSLTRGYFFTAPTTVIVTHLQVPDEMPSTAATDRQIVALYKLKAAPPAYSQTVNVTPVFFDAGTPSGQRIALPKPEIFLKGEVVAVLGAMGTTTGSVRNSYGAAKVPSEVLGMPITLERCGMQINIGGTKGVGDLWSEVNGSIARVRIWVSGHGAADQYGTGAPGAILDYSDPNPPSIGKTGGMIVRSTDANNNASALSIGAIRINVPSPWAGNLLSTPTLFLLLNPTKVPTGFGAGSGHRYTFPIPNQASLSGTKLTFQGAVGNPTTGISLTNGMGWMIQL